LKLYQAKDDFGVSTIFLYFFFDNYILEKKIIVIIHLLKNSKTQNQQKLKVKSSTD
jgi:hypothetical protein